MSDSQQQPGDASAAAPEGDLRNSPRLKMYAGVFITLGDRAFLTELSNVSAGGVMVRRPDGWPEQTDETYRLYFVLDRDRILAARGTVIHAQNDELGFEFLPGYALQSEQLLAESRNWR
ncbi:MAG: PilZ domain-containing protein [Pseudomonadota bacterium]